MTVTPVNSAAASPAQSPAKSGLASLDQGDFLRLMTVQMQHQDPFDPVDQKEMLAQMAQFSSLAGVAEMGDTLKSILARLDAAFPADIAPTAQPTT